MNQFQRNRLKNIIYSDRFETSDYTQSFSSKLYLQKVIGASIFIYGINRDILDFIKLFRNEGLDVAGIVCPEKKYKGKSAGGVKIYSPDEAAAYVGGIKYCFVLHNHYAIHLKTAVNRRISDVVSLVSGCKSRKIKTMLLKKGIVRKFYDWETDRKLVLRDMDRAGITEWFWLSEQDKRCMFRYSYYDWDAGRQAYYQKQEQRLYELAEKLEDERSMDTLTEYVRSYCENDRYLLRSGSFRYKYFYGDEDKEEIYTHIADEVWLNCGAGYGETVFSYLGCGFNFKHIYAVDADNSELKNFRESLQIVPGHIRKKITIVNEKISDVSDIKKIIGSEKLTLLNADIEGAELELLKGIKSVLIKDRPVLSICLYHKREDLLDIPLYLSSVLDNYKYLLRKFVSGCNNKSGNNELVLYAVPAERYCKGK